jgi:hypothetical protein
MRVLLVEGQVGEAEEAERLLRASGHEVERCVDVDAAAFPCNGMLSGECPLEHQVIDAAVLVRSDVTDTHTPREDGARCALRRHVPLVLAGDVDGSPYADWATEISTSVADLPEALARAGEAVLDRHTRAARRSFQAVLVQHDLDPAGADAAVHRDGTQLRVLLFPPASLDPKIAEMAAVRVAGAIRDFDPYAAKIDVTVE